MTAARPRPLDGVRVLDFGRFIAAPYCGMMLADMGAEVLRVDRPGGEEDRSYGRTGPNGSNFVFPNFGRNKKGITLDVLRRDAPHEVLADLVSRCDVFLHNFSPGAVRVFGLGYDDVRAMREDVIYAGISCYGSTGPYATRSGFDQIAQVMSGACALTGYEHEPPMRSAVPWVDYSTGLLAAFGTVLALRHRDATGEGQEVDCALLQTAVSYTSPMIGEALVTGRERPRIANRMPYVGPTDLYRCRDGWVYIATVTDGMWKSLMDLIGRPDLAAVPAHSTDEGRFEARAEIDCHVEEWMADREVADVVAEMERARIPCGVYRTTAEVHADPHVQARAMLEWVDMEEPGMERVPVSGVPVKLSATPGEVRHRAPRPGEHNDECYRGPPRLLPGTDRRASGGGVHLTRRFGSPGR